MFGLEEQVEFGEDSDLCSYENYTFTTNSSSLNAVTYMSGSSDTVLSVFSKMKNFKIQFMTIIQTLKTIFFLLLII